MAHTHGDCFNTCDEAYAELTAKLKKAEGDLAGLPKLLEFTRGERDGKDLLLREALEKVRHLEARERKLTEQRERWQQKAEGLERELVGAKDRAGIAEEGTRLMALRVKELEALPAVTDEQIREYTGYVVEECRRFLVHESEWMELIMKCAKEGDRAAGIKLAATGEDRLAHHNRLAARAIVAYDTLVYGGKLKEMVRLEKFKDIIEGQESVERLSVKWLNECRVYAPSTATAAAASLLVNLVAVGTKPRLLWAKLFWGGRSLLANILAKAKAAEAPEATTK